MSQVVISVKDVSTKDLQRALNEWGYKLKVDGLMGPKTESALLDFQKKNGLYMDGIVGNQTWAALNKTPDEFEAPKQLLKFLRVDCDEFDDGKGAEMTYLREDAVSSFKAVIEDLHRAGAIMTSAGGRRLLDASVGPNRSQTSLHYLGLAHDLSPLSGMVNPETDPYVVIAQHNAQGLHVGWVVMARCDPDVVREASGPTGARRFEGDLALEAWKNDATTVKVEGLFVNLSSIMHRHGWRPIPARRSFFTGKNPAGAEWWHFQFEKNLKSPTRMLVGKKGKLVEEKQEPSTFGGELVKSYRINKLRKYSLWNHRHRTWGVDWH